MSINRILSKLRKKEECFFSRDELMEYSQRFHYPLKNVINYLESQDSLIEIFKDVYYIKPTPDIGENYNVECLLEIIFRALNHIEIKDAYVGLYSALRLNGIKNESDEDDEKKIYIITDKDLSKKSIEYHDNEVRFIKLKSSLTDFGVIENGLRYSDPEKTILDLSLLWKKNGKHDMKIASMIREFGDSLSEKKMKEYGNAYGVEIQNILKIVYK